MTQVLASVAALGATTVLQAIRSRLLWVSVVFAVVMVGLSMSAAGVALYEQARIIVDLLVQKNADLVYVVIHDDRTPRIALAFPQEEEDRFVSDLVPLPVSRAAMKDGEPRLTETLVAQVRVGIVPRVWLRWWRSEHRVSGWGSFWVSLGC